MNALTIAASGLQASVARLDASASNIANASTIGTPVGSASSFSSVTAPKSGTGSYRPVDIRQSAAPGGGVATLAGLRQPSSFPLYDPSSPSADASAMVAAPNVDPASEIVDQIQAAQAYKSNLSVIRTADAMEGALLDLSA
jgi:flagellar basal-body rod protein FlgC